MSKIKKVAVIGTGVIGTGWIIRCLAHNKIVFAYDKNLGLKKSIILEIKRTWPYVKKLFNKKKLNLNNFKFSSSIKEALNNAEFIIECAPENYSIKKKTIKHYWQIRKKKFNNIFKFIWLVTNQDLFKMF